MRTRYDHIDLSVRSLAEARPFYETLLPALGFTRDVRIERWLQFEAAGTDGVTEFFGVTESSRHVANECRIAFWADSPSEVDRLRGDHRPGRRSECRRPRISRRPGLLCGLFRRSQWQSIGNLPSNRRRPMNAYFGNRIVNTKKAIPISRCVPAGLADAFVGVSSFVAHLSKVNETGHYTASGLRYWR